ncbi:hypothetical protein MHU86_9187 [Fragilaria crotonensis]|nr:hypothetical protein MHU86_9187 [Fragilaria crotonensis]
MSLDDLLQEATASLSLLPLGASVSFASPVAASPSPASMEGLLALLKGCKIKSHGTNKIPAFDDSRFFIFRVSGATVFSQPSVPMSKVPSSTQAEWAGKEWSLPMWVKAFRAVTNADDELASEDDIKSEVKLLDEAEVFRTPAKKRKAQKWVARSRKWPLYRTVASWIMNKLQSSWRGAVQNLMSSLGSAVEMDPKFEAPTLWGTTSFIGEEVDRLGLDVNQSKVETSEAVTEMKSVVGRMDQVEKSKVEDEAKIVAVLTSVIKRIQGVGSEIEAIKTDVAKRSRS